MHQECVHCFLFSPVSMATVDKVKSLLEEASAASDAESFLLGKLLEFMPSIFLNKFPYYKCMSSYR